MSRNSVILIFTAMRTSVLIDSCTIINLPTCCWIYFVQCLGLFSIFDKGKVACKVKNVISQYIKSMFTQHSSVICLMFRLHIVVESQTLKNSVGNMQIFRLCMACWCYFRLGYVSAAAVCFLRRGLVLCENCDILSGALPIFYRVLFSISGDWTWFFKFPIFIIWIIWW
jgi:hypothetical protein